MPAEGVTGVAAIAHDPLGHARQSFEKGNRVRQFISQTGRRLEGDGAALPVGRSHKPWCHSRHVSSQKLHECLARLQILPFGGSCRL